MVRPKAPSKKHQKQGGVDFKKIRRKIGRKLPPPNNATNTEIKSKAIILPEQSVAAEKEGLAVNKKGLTLKELLQQTSHHNAKVRKDALVGIRDLFLKYPLELRLHRYAVIEKLRERIGDDDKVVRETLYQLFKSLILPRCREENQGPLVALIMAYIFNAMTNLAVDVRLMAFKFLDLVVEFYPPTFSLYAEKILQNYEEILGKNQLYVQDKGKLKMAMTGLVHCLSLLPSNKEEAPEKDDNGQTVLHAFQPVQSTDPTGFSINIQKLKDLVPVLVSCFQELTPLVRDMQELDTRSFDCMLYVLQSIDLALKFFVYGKYVGKPESPPYGRPHVNLCDQNIVSVLLKKLLVLFPLSCMNQPSGKDAERYFILNTAITDIFFQLGNWICHPDDVLENFLQVISQWTGHPDLLLKKFLEFIENALCGKMCNDSSSKKTVHGKCLVSLLSLVPKLVLQAMPNLDNLDVGDALLINCTPVSPAGNWNSCLLQAFTVAFENCNPESSLKLACLSTIEELSVSKKEFKWCLDSVDREFRCQRIWIRSLPLLLVQLGDKNPHCSKAVLHLLLRLGQRAPSNSDLRVEYDCVQNELCHFYSACQGKGNVAYGPFVRLDEDCQELAVCCLHYFSHLDSLFLKSVARCCIYEELRPSVLHRVIEVLHSAYRAGHVNVADHVSFLITILACFEVSSESGNLARGSSEDISRREIFKSLVMLACRCLSQIGDHSFVLQMVEAVTIGEMCQRPPDNICAMLTVLSKFDSKPTRLSEQSIIKLSESLPGYMIDIVQSFPDDDNRASAILRLTRQYFLLPCFFLFDRSHGLLHLVLTKMRSSLNDEVLPSPSSNRINAVVGVLIFMHKDVKMRQILPLYASEFESIMQNIHQLESCEDINATFEERKKIQCAYDRLKIIRSSLAIGMPAS